MPRSNNPYDLINALEDKYTELSSDMVNSATDITAADEVVEDIDYTDYIDADVSDIVDKIIKYNIATLEEIQLVADVLGLGQDWTVEMLNDIINARTGYDDIKTYIGEVYPNED